MVDKWCGWAGTILDVDLTRRKTTRVPLSKELARKFVGGSTLMSYFLYKELEPGTDPLSPDNLLMIGQGPLSGTIAPSSGRYQVYARSPLTGTIGRSNGGGFFGPELRWAGYDLIIIRGAADKPVYLWIDDDRVEIRDAGHLWGKDTWETQRIIREELGDDDIQTLKIGPAGENMCFSACLIGDLSRAAGKCSNGASWGAKKLKAIAVRGTRGVNIARPAEMGELCVKLALRAREDPAYAIHSSLGTPSWVSDPLVRGVQVGYPAMSDCGTNALAKHFDKNLACWGCHLHCSHWYSVKEGKYKGTKGEGLEGNAVIFGNLVTRINNSAFTCVYNNICNKLGIDVDHPGHAIRWATDLYENKIINKTDTDGLELYWGNEDAALEILRKMAYKEGFGAVLDGYPLRAAQQIGRGSEKYIGEVKGGFQGHSGLVFSIEWSLGLAVSTRGADHLIGAPYITTPTFGLPGMSREYLEKLGAERLGDSEAMVKAWKISPAKSRYVYDLENLMNICDSTGVCKFASEYALYTSGIHMDDFAALLTCATGEKFTPEDLVAVAEREAMLERAYNCREGFRRDDDYPTALSWEKKRHEPHPRFVGKLPITVQDYDKVLDAYYELRGFDLETGLPAEAKLRALGLDDVLADLKQRKVLA